jgi:putative spermidine/putrescine transport system ATP-binding protein
MSVIFDAVSFSYPGTGAGVSNICLEIADGEFLSVIGPSGSGKSTLLKLLAGFLVPQQGRIVLNGEEVTAKPAERRNIGLVFQSYALFPHMSVVDNVAYPLKVRGMKTDERRRKAAAGLARVGLAGFAARAPGTLSGGQQQRVALARAMVFSPEALLLDEPLSALDASLRSGMRDEIRSVQREAHISTLFVTHDQEEALSMSDRVAVMFEGRIAQVDAPKALYDRPNDAEVAAFVGKANLIPGKITAEGRVDTALGALRAETLPFAVGDRVTALIRPENVVPQGPAAAAAGAPNLFRGQLAMDRFLGPVRQYDLAVDGGILQGATKYREAIEAVSIPPDAIRLLPVTSADQV